MMWMELSLAQGVWCLDSIVVKGIQVGSLGLDGMIPYARSYLQVVMITMRRSIQLHLVMHWTIYASQAFLKMVVRSRAEESRAMAGKTRGTCASDIQLRSTSLCRHLTPAT